MINEKLPQLIEALLLAANTPLTESKILSVFEEDERPSLSEFREAISVIEQSCENRGFELIELASGFTFIAKSTFAPWIQKLWEEKAPKYSKALLETLAIIAYRQPVTRGEIEDIRGVSVSSSIFKTLHEERGWIKVIGHRDVPGRPGIYATTKEFLDYFGLSSLDQLPPVSEILNSLEEQEAANKPIQKELDLDAGDENTQETSNADDEFLELAGAGSLRAILANLEQEEKVTSEQEELNEDIDESLDIPDELEEKSLNNKSNEVAEDTNTIEIEDIKSDENALQDNSNIDEADNINNDSIINELDAEDDESDLDIDEYLEMSSNSQSSLTDNTDDSNYELDDPIISSSEDTDETNISDDILALDDFEPEEDALLETEDSSIK